MISNESAGGRTVISKAVAILMTYLGGASHSLTEIAAVTGLPLSTAHRLLSDMVTCKLLERANNGEYRIGFPLRVIGAAARGAADLEEHANLVLQDLSHILDADVRLGVLCDFEVAYIEKLADRRPISRFAQGRCLPVHATAMGKALLAFSPPEVVHLLLMRGLKAFTPYTVTAPERLRRTLAMARLSRLAVVRWEFEVGRSALAVPGSAGAVEWWQRSRFAWRTRLRSSRLSVLPSWSRAGASRASCRAPTRPVLGRVPVGNRAASGSLRTAGPSFEEKVELPGAVRPRMITSHPGPARAGNLFRVTQC